MADMKPLVFEVSDISRGFFTDFVRKHQDAERIFESCDQRIFNLRRLSLEVFHRLFREPHPKMPDPAMVPPENRWALTLHQKLTDQPEFDILLDQTDSDYMAAGMATMSFMENIARALPASLAPTADPAVLRDEIKRLKAQNEPLNKEKIEQLTKLGRQAVGEMQALDQALAESRQLRGVLSKSIDKASSVVDSLRAAESVLGFGNADRSDMKVSADERIKFSESLMRNPAIREIMLIAGRMLQASAQKRRSRDAHGMGELAGVTLGDEIARILPSEIQKLACPSLRPLFHLQYLEKTLMEYEMKGREEEKKGPLVICVDVSGSMRGEREFWAKALVLTFMKIARQEKRHLRIIHFASQLIHAADINPATPKFAEILYEIGSLYNGGGTNFYPPMKSALEAVERHENMKKADIVFLTDGESSDLPAKFKKRLAKRKDELGFTVYGLLLDEYYSAHQLLETFCDQVISVKDLHSASGIEAIL
jgi:uncharacterized protein with von Willebrand factor type A (vWA) domain